MGLVIFKRVYRFGRLREIAASRLYGNGQWEKGVKKAKLAGIV